YGPGDVAIDISTNSARSCWAAICIPTINVIWAVGVLGTGPEHGIPHEQISVSPERVVIAPRPERKGQKIAGEEGPEHWSEPAAATSTVPATPVAPVVPSGSAAQSARA